MYRLKETLMCHFLGKGIDSHKVYISQFMGTDNISFTSKDCDKSKAVVNNYVITWEYKNHIRMVEYKVWENIKR